MKTKVVVIYKLNLLSPKIKGVKLLSEKLIYNSNLFDLVVAVDPTGLIYQTNPLSHIMMGPPGTATPVQPMFVLRQVVRLPSLEQAEHMLEK